MKNTQYIAITASAGSGKTYTLVKNFLALCLARPNNKEAIRHILALTFTNKAANEMKARLIEWLKIFTSSEYKSSFELKDIQKTLEEAQIKVSLEELHFRSQKVLDYVLHHYSLLSIGTIDKFNAKLIRSFSYELGLAHQFNLEIKSEPYLIEAVDFMLDQIGENKEFSGHILDYIQNQLNEEANPNLSELLYAKAKIYDHDIHAGELEKNKDFDWNAYEQIDKEIRTREKDHRKKAAEIAKASLDLMEKQGVNIEDFALGSRGGLGSFFEKSEKFFAKEANRFPFPTTSEEKAVANFDKMASAKGKPKEAEINFLVPLLKENRLQIIDHHIQSIKLEKIRKELLGLKVNSEIQEQLAHIEKENDLVLLSKFNLMIQEHIRREPSAFIYEKIGAQYNHFFFDEFQDTSRIQWNNISPLRDEAISSENSSFTLVGDPKQSIYRFRGGDSELMLEITSGKEGIRDTPLLKSLDTNYRSAESIVSFNNELYDYLSRGLKPAHQLLFSTQAQQKAHKKEKGRVKISLSEEATIALFFEELADKMHRDIQEGLDNGFSFSDFTILCTKNDHIVALSESLGSLEVQYNGENTLIKTISDNGLTLDSSLTLRALIQFFNWQLKPESRHYLVNALYLLNELGRITLSDFTEEILYLLSLKETDLKEYLKVYYQLNLDSTSLSDLNLYNYIEAYTHEFELASRETSYLLNFLEVVFTFTQNQGMGLSDFLTYWDQEASKTAIQTSESIDAIKLMTIHSAKGLQFPIVLLPLLNDKKLETFTQWFPLENLGSLKTVNISQFHKDHIPYDSSMNSFNEENIYKNKIDQLCLTYVATTRPEEQLFIYLQKSTPMGSLSGIHEYIQSKNPENLPEFDLYAEVENSYEKQSKNKEEKRNSLKIETLSSTNFTKHKINIATPSKNYQATNQTVRVGLFVHEILERIAHRSQLDSVLKSYLIKGVITNEEKIQISERLLGIFQNPQYAPYFETDAKVRSEKEILIRENGKPKTYRVDRLIETDEGLIVIDFKTGAPNPSHKKQLSHYQSILESIGEKVLRTELIYL